VKNKPTNKTYKKREESPYTSYTRAKRENLKCTLSDT
jgi:hypothetical protein